MLPNAAVTTPAFRVPADTVVAPVYVLVPDKVRVEVALVSLVSAPAPEMTPDRVWVAELESSSVSPAAIEILPA